MVSSKFSGPARIQQPPPVCKKVPPPPPVLPPGGPTLCVQAEWKGFDDQGHYRAFSTYATFTPDMPADNFTAIASTPDAWFFTCDLARLDPTTWNCHVEWLQGYPIANALADGDVTIVTNPPVLTPAYLLTFTTPAGQYCTVRFFNS